VCTEEGTVLRAVEADFFFNCLYLEIPSDNRIWHIPRCFHYHEQGLRLETFQDLYVGSGSRIPEFSDPAIALQKLQTNLLAIQNSFKKLRMKANGCKSIHVTFTTRK
jgi:hypothetical protein